ncbi:hypothetical protein DFAR_1310022 [Desulfarculales bacterium]
MAADLLAPGIVVALKLLLHPQRLRAGHPAFRRLGHTGSRDRTYIFSGCGLGAARQV